MAQKTNFIAHTHKLPSADPEFCSCCRKSIIKNQHNVIRIDQAPEVIHDLKGQVLGQEGVKRPKAFYHAQCFESHHYNLPGRIECEHCGILSMAKTLRDGRSIKDVCLCSCHSGKDYCSLLLK